MIRHVTSSLLVVASLRRKVNHFEPNAASRDSVEISESRLKHLTLANGFDLPITFFPSEYFRLLDFMGRLFPTGMSQNTAPFTCGLEPKTYRDWNGDRQWHTLVFYNHGFSWWIKVSVQGILPESITSLGYLKRRSAFQEFVHAIDFCQLQLLDDTVSNIVLAMTDKADNSIPIRQDKSHNENPYVALIHQMRWEIMEDRDRVVYPPANHVQGLRNIDAGYLQNTQMIASAVFTVNLEHQKFVLKTIDRPIYEPRDTKDMLNEINALAQFRGEPNIAQLVGLVESENPYKTSPSNTMPRVITGFLLEYYSEGSLDRITSDDTAVTDHLRIQWAIQVGKSLKLLHMKGWCHLDIKPSNIVLDSERNAFLIDIGGAGCYTWEWLSPEMQMYLEENTEKTPADAHFDAQVATDCWAYGKLLCFIATEWTPVGTIAEKLRAIGEDLAKPKPETRTTLSNTLAILNELS